MLHLASCGGRDATLLGSLVIVWVATLSGSQPAGAQNQQPPRFRSGVEVVTVDVTVVDDDGRPVLNLQPDDFAVEVDGVRRRVVTADWISLAPAAARTTAGRDLPAVAPPPAPPPAPYTSNENPEGGRFIVLFIDRLNIRFEGLLAHRDTINSFIDRLQPSDRVAVVTSGFGSGNSVGFSTNRERAKEAIVRTAGQRGLVVGAEPPNHALRELLTAIKGIGAAKTIVLISEGFPLADEPLLGDRRPFLVELEHLAAEARTVIYALKLDPRITDIRQSTQDTNLGPDLTQPAAQNRRGGGTSQGGVPAELSGGAGTMPGPANAAVPNRVEAGSGLYSVAAVTGGSMFTAVMTADAAFDRIESELSGYYLLGVESDPSHKDGKPHAISVEVERGGVTVRSRRQLIVTPPARAPRTSEEALLPAFSSPVPISALPLRVSTFVVHGASASNLQLLVHAEAGGDDYSSSKTVVLGYIVTDRNDRVVQRRAGTSRLRPVLGDRPSPLQVTTTVTLEPGDYTLKLAVADGDRVGSVEHPIHAAVTSGGSVSFSDLIVGGSDSAKPAIPPPVGATIRHGYLQGFLEAYGPGASALKARFDIAAAPDGPALVGVPVTPVAAGQDRARLSQVISVRDLAPGRYVLRAVLSAPNTPAHTLIRAFEKD